VLVLEIIYLEVDWKLSTYNILLLGIGRYLLRNISCTTIIQQRVFDWYNMMIDDIISYVFPNN